MYICVTCSGSSFLLNFIARLLSLPVDHITRLSLFNMQSEATSWYC